MRPSIPMSLLVLGALCVPATAQGFYEPPLAVDINADPTIVEINLTAAPATWQYVPGQNTNIYAYNGTTPGPTIVANIGDTLIVHFTNNLPEPTTIHWHGVETPADMDGSHIAQRPIKPGETFDYVFPLLREGLLWYHPHVNTHHQVEMGLHGCLLVRDPTLEGALGFDQIEEHILVFDDVLLNPTTYQIEPPFPVTTPIENAEHQLNGRVGNHLLCNGKLASGMTLTVPNGQPQRWRIVNVANTTFCRLDINDPVTGLTDAKIWEIGTDTGLSEGPQRRIERCSSTVPPPPVIDHPGQALILQFWQGMYLQNGDRLDVIFTPIGNHGDVFRVQQKDWFRGRHKVTSSGGTLVVGPDPNDGAYPDQPYIQFQLQGPDPGTGEYTPPPVFKTYPPRRNGTKNVTLMFGHGNPTPQGDVTLFAQAKMQGGQMVPLPSWKVDSFEAFDFNVGDTVLWEVHNLTAMDHPFHTHGFFFELLEWEFIDQVTAINNFKYEPPKRVLEDTIRLPPRLGAKGTSRAISRYLMHIDDTGRPGQITAHGENATAHMSGGHTSGGWLFHCHVLEHATRGMLSFFEVHDPADPFTLLGKHLGGTYGLPGLTARGNLTPGTAVHLDLVNAMPNGLAAMVVGFSANPFPFAGGTIVPAPPQIPLVGIANPLGEVTWSLTEWSVLPPGTPLYWQAGFGDPLAPQGLALSNALLFRTP